MTKNGSKKKNNGKNAFLYVIIAFVAIFLVAIYFVLWFLHPVGVFEYIGFLKSTSGSGEYSIEIAGGKPSYTVGDKNKYFIVNSSSVNCYNSNGKVIFEEPHSYAEPVLKISDTRYLLYGQGESELSVHTLSDTLFMQTFSGSIICATLSDSGGYAVASKADGYESSVAVFDKNNKKIYEWFSPDETVNSVALTPNGKNLAVATLKVENGKFISTLYVLEFNSANAVLKRVYDDTVIYDVKDLSNNSVCVVTENKVEFVNFKKNLVKEYGSDYNIVQVKHTDNRVTVLSTTAANQEECFVDVYKTTGESIASFKVETGISDVKLKYGKIYLLGASRVYKYDTEGKLLAECDVAYDALSIEIINEKNVACIGNSTIDKYEIVNLGD